MKAKSGPPEGSSMERCPQPSAPNMDRITNLAPELIEQIFLRLPLKDAVRTSALSRIWRARWRSAVRQLDFDGWRDWKEEWLPVAVTGVLDAVTGPIDSFTLRAKHPSFPLRAKHPDHDENIPGWMVRALALGVTAFDVSTNNYSEEFKIVLPKLFFICRGLTRLSLTAFKVRFPPGFEGFKGLTALKLCYCEVFPEGVLDGVIARSSSLTELHIINIKGGCTNLEVSSVSLCSFSVSSYFDIERFTMKSCPNLKRACISIKKCSPIDLLHGPCSNVQYLRLGRPFYHHCRPPKRLSHELSQLRKLIVHIDVASKEEVEVLLCILRSAPALQCLHASCYCCVSDTAVFWENREWQGLILNELSSVRLQTSRRCASRKAHLDFCKFLFANSPRLQDFCLLVSDDSPFVEPEGDRILHDHLDLCKFFFPNFPVLHDFPSHNSQLYDFYCPIMCWPLAMRKLELLVAKSLIRITSWD